MYNEHITKELVFLTKNKTQGTILSSHEPLGGVVVLGAFMPSRDQLLLPLQQPP